MYSLDLGCDHKRSTIIWFSSVGTYFAKYVCPNMNIRTYMEARDLPTFVLRVVQSYDPACTEDKSLRLELNPDETFLLPTASLLSTGLNFIAENRKSRKSTSLFSIRSELEASVSLKKKSSSRRIREAGDIMKNMTENFFN